MDNEKEISEFSAPKRAKKQRNIVPKILSVIAAISLWFYAMAVESPNHESDFNGLSIDLYGMSELESTYGLSPIIGEDQTVNVVLSGKKKLLNEMKPEDISAYVDVSDITESGRYELEVSITAPAGISVVSHFPRTLNVYLDQITSKQVPVSIVRSSAILSSELSLGTITTDVDYVKISGPKELVDTVHSAQLNLQLGELKNSTRFTDKVVLVDSNRNIISNPMIKVSPSSVTANVPLIVTKDIVLSYDCIYGYFNDSNARVAVSPSTITVSMPAEMSKTFNTLKVVTIDEKALAGNTSLTCPITLPEGVKNLSSTEAATVEITLKNTNTVTYTAHTGYIEFENVPDGYYPHVPAQNFNFTLRGPADIMSQIGMEDIAIKIDLGNYSTEGTVSAKIDVVTSSSDVYLLSGLNYPVPTVTVELRKFNEDLFR